LLARFEGETSAIRDKPFVPLRRKVLDLLEMQGRRIAL
jgi:hypothetical protein